MHTPEQKPRAEQKPTRTAQPAAPQEQSPPSHRAPRSVSPPPVHHTATRAAPKNDSSGQSMAAIVARRPFEKPDNPRPELSPTVPPDGVWLPNCADCGPGPTPENTHATALPNPARSQAPEPSTQPVPDGGSR
jgi:hypothetical protein